MGSVIALVAVLTVLLSGLATGLVNDGISGLRALPVSHLAFQHGADSTFSRSTIDAQSVAAIGAVPGVQAEPFGLTIVNAKTEQADNVDLALMGVADDGFIAQQVFAGTSVPPGGAIVSQGLIDQGVRVGGTLAVDRSTVVFDVVGVAPAATYGHVDAVYVRIEDWQRVSRPVTTDPSTASAVAIRGGDSAALVTAGKAADLDVVTRTQAYAGSPGYSAETSTMTLIRGFLYLISAMILGSFFTVWTIQRRSEIGLQKALGASTGAVLRDALGQVLIVLTVAAGLGALVGFGLGKLIEGGEVPFALDVGSVLRAAAILIVSGAVGMLVGIRKVTNVDPMIALGAAA
jgi:putative ABC transport system permease protein